MRVVEEAEMIVVEVHAQLPVLRRWWSEGRTSEKQSPGCPQHVARLATAMHLPLVGISFDTRVNYSSLNA